MSDQVRNQNVGFLMTRLIVNKTLVILFQDPFGEKRGHFDYQSVLKRLETIKKTLSEKQDKLETIKMTLSEKQDKSLDEDCAESDNHTNSQSPDDLGLAACAVS